MIRIEKQDFDINTNFLENLELYEKLIVNGVVLNDMPGEIFVDNIVNPKTCFVKTKVGKYLVAGYEGNEEFNKNFCNFLKDIKNHNIYFDLYASSNKWIEIIKDNLANLVVKLERSIYYYNSKKNIDTEDNTNHPNYKIQKMDSKLFDKYVKDVDDIYECQWESAQRFITKGFGFCIVENNELICACTTFNADLKSVEVNIVTDSKYRRNGLAYATCKKFIEYSLLNKLTAIWDAGKYNIPSNDLALKLGFEKIRDFEILFWHENQEIMDSYLKGENFF